MTRGADGLLWRAAQRAAAHYRMEARRLRRLAAEQVEDGQPLTARITRYNAALADHAADAEQDDPSPPGFVA